MKALSEISSALAEVIERVGSSIVQVEGRHRIGASGIVLSNDGVLITANHVVKWDRDIRVGLPDESQVGAELLGRDPTTDLAVLRIDSQNLVPITWRKSVDIRVGELALALGRPERTVQASLGIISALGERWRTPAGGRIDRFIQTDVVMYPGFSGGPLVNARGEALGLNTSALVRGVSVAIPISTLQSVAEAILAYGSVRRGYLGISSQPVRLPRAECELLDQETGLLLVSVEPDSPAMQGGLAMGDTIVSFDHQPVRHLDDLLNLLAEESIGQSFQMRILRGGQILEKEITVGERK